MDSARIEADFARLLASGWPAPTERPALSIGGFALLLASHHLRMAAQLVNSAVPETREFWRSKYPELVSDEAQHG